MNLEPRIAEIGLLLKPDKRASIENHCEVICRNHEAKKAFHENPVAFILKDSSMTMRKTLAKKEQTDVNAEQNLRF